MTEELNGFDADALERFKAEHDGMTPAQFAVAILPAEDQERIARTRPDLVRPRKRRP